MRIRPPNQARRIDYLGPCDTLRFHSLPKKIGFYVKVKTATTGKNEQQQQQGTNLKYEQLTELTNLRNDTVKGDIETAITFLGLKTTFEFS